MILEDDRDVPGLENIISIDENVSLRMGSSFEALMNLTVR